MKVIQKMNEYRVEVVDNWHTLSVYVYAETEEEARKIVEDYIEEQRGGMVIKLIQFERVKNTLIEVK